MIAYLHPLRNCLRRSSPRRLRRHHRRKRDLLRTHTFLILIRNFGCAIPQIQHLFASAARVSTGVDMSTVTSLSGPLASGSRRDRLLRRWRKLVALERSSNLLVTLAW